jgi:hypothetical protein
MQQAEIKPQQPGKDQGTDDERGLEHPDKPELVPQQ